MLRFIIHVPGPHGTKNYFKAQWSLYCDVDGATGSRGHVNSAVSRVTSHTPTTSIITQRLVNSPPRGDVTALPTVT
jgi:hypothetical protein